MNIRRNIVLGVLFLLLFVGMGSCYLYTVDALHLSTFFPPREEAAPEREVYVKFDMEIYDIVMTHYWQKAPDADLAELFRLSLAKAQSDEAVTLPSADRAGTEEMLAQAFARTPEEKKKPLAIDIGIIALTNMAPQGRSGLLSEKEEKSLRDSVNNIDASSDLYDTLGVERGAPEEIVQQAYEEKMTQLQASSSPEAKEKLAQVDRAGKVLTDVHSKSVYDQTKIEPSVVSKTIGEHTLYVDLAKVTPATLEEFVHALERTKDTPQLTSLIIDVRKNVGGTLDFAKYLFALFVGPNQFAFDLLVKGELKPERTPLIAAIPTLQNFEEIAILTDSMTQSTAELMTVIFKRFNMAKVVGRTTRGWGTVENTYPISTQLAEGEKHTVLLVNSLTLREDNEPIEGKGVDPDISLESANWRQQLRATFSTPGFASAIEQALKFE